MNPTEPADVDALIAEFLQAAERGQAPSPADWLARHPAHAPELATFLLDLGRFGSFLGLPSAWSEVTTDFHTGGGHGAAVVASPGQRFAEYELIEVLGQGGMGTVYRARLIGTSLAVALKQVRSTHLAGPDALRSFREEVETAACLKHPNIVPIYHVGEHQGQPFYTMALIDRGSLDRHVARYHGNFPRIAELVAAIARAVHHAHQRRILHRDLKPGNVLLDEEWKPLVADFGLATRLDEAGATASAGAPTGSLPWMAPETLRGDSRLTTAVDTWALGVILYELLTEHRPFRGKDGRTLQDAILAKEPPAPRALNPRVPRDLDAVCLRCLHKDPDRRYESANALALDLERWLRDEPIRIRQAGRAERFVKWCRRNPGLAVGAAILMACLVALTAAGLSFAADLEAKLRSAVCRDNEFVARHVASSVHQELDRLARQVVEVANDERLRVACGKGDPAAAKAVLKDGFPAAQFATTYLLDPKGAIVAHDQRGLTRRPLQREIVGVPFPGRDYFQGALRRDSEKTALDRIHFSRVFRSEDDHLDKLAVSCTVHPLPGGPPWVVVATITTDPKLGLDILLDPENKYKAVLLAPCDPTPPRPGAAGRTLGYVILVHPAFDHGERSVECPPGHPGPVPLPDEQPELRTTSPKPPFSRDEDYADPLADHGHPECGGRWLTGSARVANTELVVLVQRHYDEAVAPHQGLFRRFLGLAGGMVAVGLVSFACLRWLGVRRRPASQAFAD